MIIPKNIIINLLKKFIFSSFNLKFFRRLDKKIKYKVQHNSKIININIGYNATVPNLLAIRLYKEKHRPMNHMIVVKMIIGVKEINIIDSKVNLIFLYYSHFFERFLINNHLLSIHGSLLFHSHSLSPLPFKTSYNAMTIIVKMIIISNINSISISYHAIFIDITQNHILELILYKKVKQRLIIIINKFKKFSNFELLNIEYSS